MTSDDVVAVADLPVAEKGPILIVTYGGGHVAMLTPVARSLIAKGHPVLVLALTTAVGYLERAGIPFIGYRHLPDADQADVVAWGRKLTSELPSGGSIELAESVAYMGLNYRELVAEHGLEGAAQLFAEKGRRVFCPIGLFKRWLAELRPSLVIATSAPRSERAALEAASALGIASICAVDLFGLQEIQWINRPGYASRICVLNQQVRDMFVEKGCHPDAIVVTGNPAFDRLQQPQVQEAGRAMRAAKGWGKDETVILWASQVEPERHPFDGRIGDPTLPRRIEAVLREFVSTHANYRLVLRYHPSESAQFHSGQARVELSPPSEDLATLLHALDIVVVTSSTVGLEAHLAGRCVLSVGGSVFNQDAPYGKMGIATEVSSPEGLGAALSRVQLKSEQRPSMVSAGPLMASATHNIVELAESLLGSEGTVSPLS